MRVANLICFNLSRRTRMFNSRSYVVVHIAGYWFQNNVVERVSLNKMVPIFDHAVAYSLFELLSVVVSFLSHIRVIRR